MKRFLSLILFIFSVNNLVSGQSKNLVYVDKQGILRWTEDKSEASFFGVNYTVPFAYGYRSHKALGVDHEKAIDADVYHMSRLGLDAFRVHVWDVEITDSLGNLIQNEHLRLFDYLLFQLKKRNIKILLTPIAFWGSGYPEPDIRTNGFSSVYGKRNSVVLEAPIRAQENYVKQLIEHVNPYTKLSYKDDSDIIAVEINNEPQHSGPKEKTTDYVKRLASAIKSIGWTKPVFYNISESPAYADAVVKANVVGYTFQWYPTGLVAGYEHKGNYLSHVDRYPIPFGDTIQGFRKGSKIVYEFDAGDVLQSNMYPAMARSFRTAGFQWATQFAYDPMSTAYANTEYQTHYLNLAYTPSKAISLLIASKVFHRVPRLKNYGTYPSDTLFDVFRVSYLNQLSEMNSNEEFYYSNSTVSQPKNISKLEHIAGVGNSPVVQYSGSGSYFLDKISEGNWRLEVMPDAIQVSDPFAKPSPKKDVTRIFWNKQAMNISLPDLGSSYFVKGLNEGNNFSINVNGIFSITPGVYAITSTLAPIVSTQPDFYQFYAPLPKLMQPNLVHHPIKEVSAGQSFSIQVKITDVDSIESVLAEFRPASGKWTMLTLQKANAYEYSVMVPGEMVLPGLIRYRIIIQKKGKEYIIFPGEVNDDPNAWDHLYGDSWQTFVAAKETPLQIFDPTNDRTQVITYNPDWRNFTTEYVTSNQPSELVMKTTMNKSRNDQFMAWQLFIGDKIEGRKNENTEWQQLIIRAKANEKMKLNVGLVMKDAQYFSTEIFLDTVFNEIKISLQNMKPGSLLLLPRPYPGFLPLWFRSGSIQPFNFSDAEKLLIYSDPELPVSNAAYSLEIGKVWLTKK